jgi:thioredoxin 1
VTIVGYALGGFILLLVTAQMAVLLVSKRKRGRPPGTLHGSLARTVESGNPAMVYFFSPSCGVCRSVTPVISALRDEGCNVHTVDVSRDVETARAFGVMATPSVVTVKEGIIKDIIVGSKPENRYRAAMHDMGTHPANRRHGRRS